MSELIFSANPKFGPLFGHFEVKKGVGKNGVLVYPAPNIHPEGRGRSSNQSRLNKQRQNIGCQNVQQADLKERKPKHNIGQVTGALFDLNSAKQSF